MYELDIATKEWSTVGKMIGGHKYHAMTVVDVGQLWQYCLDKQE